MKDYNGGGAQAEVILTKTIEHFFFSFSRSVFLCGLGPVVHMSPVVAHLP